MARLAREIDGDPAAPADAITKAYFRALEPDGRAGSGRDVSVPVPRSEAGARGDDRPGADSRRAEHTPEGRVGSLLAQLPPAKAKRALPARPSALAQAIADLEPALRTTRLEELAYLVNVLLAGDKRHWRPAEAAEAVVAVTSGGYRLLDNRDLGAAVAATSIVVAFRAGVRAGTLDALRRDRR